MANYPNIGEKMPRRLSQADKTLQTRVLPYLRKIWLTDYCHQTAKHDIVTVKLERYSYLYDTAAQHLIAAWVISNGPIAHERPTSSMQGFPLTQEPGYHRGHVIPHQLGGLCDINLINQRGALNVKEFRRLEKLAVANPGALYFTYWQYDASRGDTPAFVDQGLLIPGQAPDIVTHAN